MAIKIEGNDELVLETGLYYLTSDEARVLVHFGPDRQEQRLFVRLQVRLNRTARGVWAMAADFEFHEDPAGWFPEAKSGVAK